MDDLLNYAPCGFLSFNDTGTITQVNATLCEWLEYTPEELEGHHLESILSIGGRIFYRTHIDPILKLSGCVEEIYFSLKSKSGETVAVLTNAVRHERGSVCVNDCIFMQMRQRREYEDELLQAKKAAEEASLAKAKFLSMMSHELRTPMNAILGFGQLLERSELDAFQTESVEHILSAGKHLLGLINEVLDISRIEAGKLDVSLEPVPVFAMIQQVLEMAQPLADNSDIALEIGHDSSHDSPDTLWVMCDPNRLRQILLNLTANAIKYNRAGGCVSLSSEYSPDGAKESAGKGKRLRFLVRDNGLGLSPAKQAKLFQPFERLGADRSGIEGTGLGLALSKKLVEAMDGTIGVQSLEGQGSCFWVEFPLVCGAVSSSASLKPIQKTETSDVSPLKSLVLYIEDNASNLTLMERIMKQRPAINLISAITGVSGLEMARKNLPDLILLDLQLPDIMGDEVLKRLRQDKGTRDIPVIMLSADATPRQIERLLFAGAQDYLTKPLDLAKFFHVLDAFVQAKSVGNA